MENEENKWGKWLSDELSEAELADLQKDPDYPLMKRMAETTNRWEFQAQKPAVDIIDYVKGQQSSNTVSNERSFQKTRKSRAIWPALMAAASLLLLSGGVIYFMTQVQLQTGTGQFLSHVLPDGSTSSLNADSELSYNKLSWMFSRKLHLKGEALFEVAKGQRFTVKSKQGSVQVLGTIFQVRDVETVYRVACSEGKVKVLTGNQQANLTAGQLAERLDGKMNKREFSTTLGHWKQGKTQFDEASLSEVFQVLEEQFGTKVINGEEFSERKFSGVILHDNLEESLKIVFGAMKISYSLENKKIILNP